MSQVCPPPKNRRHYLMAVVGESFNNEDGSSRQDILKTCYPGEPMRFIPEPSNPYDKNAIAVCRTNGQKIGYVSKDDIERYSKTHAVTIDKIFACRINQITGDEQKAHKIGCTLQLLELEGDEDADAVALNPDKESTAMSLITCPDCGKSISSSAPACIHCGRPMKPAQETVTPAPTTAPAAPRKNKSRPKQQTSGCAWVAAVFSAMFLFFYIGGLWDNAQYKPREDTPAKPTPQPAEPLRSTWDALGEWDETTVLWSVPQWAGLNPENIARLLGSPDSSSNTKQGVKQTFRNGSVEIVFINGGADWITINNPRLPYLASSIQALGIRASAPDASDNIQKRWNNIQGLLSVSMFSDHNGGIEYFYIKAATP